MMHPTLPLITTIALAFGLALVMGFIAVKLKLPALVGYLVAGILIGPSTPGIFADVSLAKELAEIGVMLLMFGVGLHFSLDDLMKVKHIAIPGALLQMLVATALGAAAAIFWGWGYLSAIVFGLALSVASTVVLLKALEGLDLLQTINGHIAVGWLIVEDLAMIIVLVLLAPLQIWLGGSGIVPSNLPLWADLSLIILKVSIFIALMLLVGKRVLPKLLWQIARTGSRELFILCVIAVAIGIAFVAAKIFGVSFALGAFFAGIILRESKLSQRAAEESLPLRDAFAVLFFVSVGMLFNPEVLITKPLQIVIVIGIILFGKSVAACLLVLLFRYPLQTALIVSASLAQIGEFSFILADLGTRLKILPEEGRNFILAGALISIALNPFIFKLLPLLQQGLEWFTKMVGIKPQLDPLAQLPMTTEDDYLSGQVVIVGYGQVGTRLANLLLAKSIPFVVVDDNREVIEELRETGLSAVYGNAADPLVLVEAHIAKASLLTIATSSAFNIKRMITIARKLNPELEVVVRTHDEEEAALLKEEVPGKIFFAEEEIANNMGDYILKRYGKTPPVTKTNT